MARPPPSLGCWAQCPVAQVAQAMPQGMPMNVPVVQGPWSRPPLLNKSSSHGVNLQRHAWSSLARHPSAVRSLPDCLTRAPRGKGWPYPVLTTGPTAVGHGALRIIRNDVLPQTWAMFQVLLPILDHQSLKDLPRRQGALDIMDALIIAQANPFVKARDSKEIKNYTIIYNIK